MNTTTIPAIRLSFERIGEPPPEPPLLVIARDTQGGGIVVYGTLRTVAWWLQNRGYRYVQGTNGVWRAG